MSRRRKFGSVLMRSARDGHKYVQARYQPPVWAYSKWPDLPRHYTKNFDAEYTAMAEAWLAEQERLIKLGSWEPPRIEKTKELSSTITFREYALDFVQNRRKPNGQRIAPTTREKYLQYLDDYLLPVLGRVGQARVHVRDTGRVLHRDRAAHAAAPRETGGPARRGALADRQGEAPGHRRVRLHADRRGGLQVPVPGHIGFLRDPERHPHHEHRVLRLGTRARRQEHGRRVDRPHRAPRQARQIRGRLIPQRARPHDQIARKKRAEGSDDVVSVGNQPPMLLKNSAHTVEANLQKHRRVSRREHVSGADDNQAALRSHRQEMHRPDSGGGQGESGVELHHTARTARGKGKLRHAHLRPWRLVPAPFRR